MQTSISLCNIKDLFKIKFKIWDQQRTVDIHRVQELIDKFLNNLKTKNELCIRNPIHFCLMKGEYYLIDGQHRYLALKTLYENDNLPDSMIAYSIIRCNDSNDIRFEFNNINNITPMPECYIQPSKIIDIAVEYLKGMYGNFRVGSKRRPNIDIDKFKSKLIEYEIINKHNVKTSDELIDNLNKLNEYYKRLDLHSMIIKLATSPKDETFRRLFKQIHNKKLFFVGLFKTDQYFIWITDLQSILKRSD